jgi:hypothetical protein
MKNTSQSVQSGKGQSSKPGRGRPLKYKVFATLGIGQFRLFPMKVRNNVVTSAYLFAKRHGLTFKANNLEKTVKITRMA